MQKRVLRGATCFFGSERGYSEEQRVEKEGTPRSRTTPNRVPEGADFSKTGYPEEQRLILHAKQGTRRSSLTAKQGTQRSGHFPKSEFF